MQNPSDEPTNSPSLSDRLDQAIEVILARLRSGEFFEIEDVVRQFPGIENEIREIYPALQIADQLRVDHVNDETSPSTDASVDVDRELLYGAFALQCGLLSLKQFLRAFESWNLDRSKSYKQILFDGGHIKPETRHLLDGLFEQQLSLGDFHGLQSIDGRTIVFTGALTPSSSAPKSNVEWEKASPHSERYRFVRSLDRGGLGIVSVALDSDLNREVAIKEIREDRAGNAILQKKFLLEAQVTGGLEHPGIVPIYGIGHSTDGRPYYAMRLIKGNNLRLHIQAFHDAIATSKHPFDGPKLRRLLWRFCDVCNAIEYAHARGILHRDIKPMNIMLGRYGETLVVDWGLAKAVGESLQFDSNYEFLETMEQEQELPLTPSGSDPGSETRQGSVIGTPAYASPEQLAGHVGLVGVPSDVYGLGATLYELLCGKPPASGTLLEIVRIVSAGKWKRPRELQPAIPRPLEAICQKAMSIDPSDRYRSANQMRLDIERWLDDDPVEAYPEPWYIRLRRAIRKHPTVASTCGVSVLLSTIGLMAITTVVSQKNQSLALLNRKLDATNTELSSTNTRLEESNVQLDQSVRDLAEANQRESQAKLIAQEQSELALSTLNAVVFDIQLGLKNLPGGSEVRRRLLATSLSRLDQIATKVASQESAERSTLIALLEIGDLVLQFGTNSSVSVSNPTASKLESKDPQSPGQIAMRALTRAEQIGLSRTQSAPNDRQSAIDLSWVSRDLANIHFRMGNSDLALAKIGEVLSRIETLLSLNDKDLEVRAIYARCLHVKGDFLTLMGRSTEAKVYLERELAQLRELILLDQDNSEHRSRLSSCLEFLSDCENSLNNIQASDRLMQEASDASRDVLAKAPNQLPNRKRVADVLWKHSSRKLALGDISAAESMVAESVSIYRDAVVQDPQNLSIAMHLSNALEREAAILERRSKLDEAVVKLKESLSIRSRLADLDPDDFMRTRQVSISHDRLGLVELQRGNPKEALDWFRMGLASSQKLSDKDPNNPNLQRDLLLSHQRMAKVFMELGDYKNALMHRTEAKDSAERLSKRDPENTTKKRDWEIALSDFAWVQSRLGNSALAREAFLEALRLCRELSAVRPDNLEFLRDLSINLENLCVHYDESGEFDKAAEYVQQCIDVRRSIAERNANDVRAQVDLGGAYNNASQIFGRLGKFDESLQHSRDGIRILQSVVAENGSDLSALEDLAIAEMRYAVTLSMTEKLSEAAEAVRSSWKRYDKLVDRPTTPVTWLRGWVETGKLAAQLELNANSKEQASQALERCRTKLKEMIDKGIELEWAREQFENLDHLLPDDPIQ